MVKNFYLAAVDAALFVQHLEIGFADAPSTP